VEPRLRPREDPGDRAERRDAALGLPLRRPAADVHLAVLRLWRSLATRTIEQS